MDAQGRREPVPATPGLETAPGLIVYRFAADLFYANTDRFVDEVRALVEHAPTPVRWFVVEASAMTDLDYSAARSLLDLIDDLGKQQVRLVFARVTPYLRADLDRHGITRAVGEHHVFESLHQALAAVNDPNA
jgi:MFS superfamily sulfate permease-like transporter